MSREYTTVIGSGQVPHLALAPPYNFPDGTYPVPSQRNDLRTRTGEGAVVLNPEDFSVSIGLNAEAITVGTSATALPTSPLENRRALAVHNNSSITIFIGGSNVTVANGFPLLTGQQIAFDIQGTPNVRIYAIASSNADVRILELA